MGLLKNPIGGIDIHNDNVLFTSKTLDYIITSNDDGFECYGSKKNDITDMICRDLTSNVRVLLGKTIKEHQYLKVLDETHIIDDEVIYYLLSYKNENLTAGEYLSFLFNDMEDCLDLQQSITALSLSMKRAYLEHMLDRDENASVE